MVGEVVSPRVLIIGISVLSTVTLAVELLLDAPTALIVISLVTMAAIFGIFFLAWHRTS